MRVLQRYSGRGHVQPHACCPCGTAGTPGAQGGEQVFDGSKDAGKGTACCRRKNPWRSRVRVGAALPMVGTSPASSGPVCAARAPMGWAPTRGSASAGVAWCRACTGMGTAAPGALRVT